jgi:predicted dehydrogenase
MPVAIDMRHLINAGYLGGPPIHLESVYCYEFNDERYAKAMLGDRSHWIRRLPGKLLHNVISHGIGKIVEFLRDEDISVLAFGFTSHFLEGIHEGDIVDELRVIISDGHRTTGYFTFSSQMSPPLHQFRVYGPKNSLIADFEHQTLTRVQKNYKSYLNQFLPPLLEGRDHIRNGCRNMRRFVRRELHAEAGIHTLIESFYRSITDSARLPISYRDILITARIMEEVFRQIE